MSYPTLPDRQDRALTLLLASSDDPLVFLRLGEIPELTSFVEKRAGERFNFPIEDTRDTRVVMRLYDAFPTLRPAIGSWPLDAGNLILNGRYELMRRELDRIHAERIEGSGDLVALAYYDAPLSVILELVNVSGEKPMTRCDLSSIVTRATFSMGRPEERA